jgi:hypothetical protein
MDFHCNLSPGPAGHVLADVSLIHPLAAFNIDAAARIPGHAAALRDADRRRDFFADRNAQSMHSSQYLLKPWGDSVPAPCNSSAKPTTPLFPNWGTSVPSASPMRTTSCPWCSAVPSFARLPLQRASTPHACVLAGSRGRRCPPRSFRTRHASAVTGFICVGQPLGSGGALLNLVGFCWVVAGLPVALCLAHCFRCVLSWCSHDVCC